MSTLPAWRSRLWLFVALAATLAKFWLSRGQGVYAIGSAGLDDRLFLELAHHLVHGNWLGTYNELTLAKGPFYSFFIAAAFWLGVPLFLAQHAFYAAACGLFARALRPAITSAGARCAIYLLLLWNPMTFDAPAMGRVLRQHVYGPLGLMIVSGLAALYLRRDQPTRRQVPWAVLAGLAAGAFHLTREEGVWLLPAAALLAAAVLHGAARISRATLRHTAGLLGVIAAVAALPVLFVCVQNKRHYGWFGTCEMRSTEFQDAYGAMLRVRIGPDLPLVPVTREAREAMAKVSPKFAELQQQFEAGVAQGWAGASEFHTHLPPEQGQIGGGWMMWALREAAAKAGYHTDAGRARYFYKHLARELNQACDDGRLPAGPRRSGFVPPWRDEWTGATWHHAFGFADFVIRFSQFSARPPLSTGSPEELQLFRDLTGERISPPEGELDVVGAAEYMMNLGRVDRLQAIGKTLRPLLLALTLLALVMFAGRAAQMLWQRRWTFPLTLAAAVGSAVAASILIHAVIETTSFPVRTISSFAPIYPLVLVFGVAVIWDVVAAWRERRIPAVATEEPAPAAAEPTLAPWISRALPWLAGVAALAPFLLWHGRFNELFWFGDDFFLIDQMAQMGFWPWTARVFAENFVPLFKVLWGGAVLSFGSYAAMLWLMWLTHALNAALLHRLLARAGFGWPGALGAALVFALPPANLETLGWSVQWSAILATTFLLFGLCWQQAFASDAAFNARRDLPLMLFSAASACSFSRGVLTGPVLALGLLLPLAGTMNLRTCLARLPAVFLYLLPAVGVALVISLNSGGNHQHLSGHTSDVAEFGFAYFLFNPAHALLGNSVHPVVLGLLAGVKLAVVGGAIWLARGPVRLLLVVLLAYDLGNALLLGVGRYHTGFLAAMSSRYQYGALLATLPAAAYLASRALDRLLAGRDTLRGRAWAATLVVAAGACLVGWPKELAEFTGWRGTELRALIAAPATGDPEAKVPALEFMHIERAKALTRAYDLH
jgi:hypothetical protein